MTDNEVIKALEKEKYSFSDATRTYRAIEESIDLINRQNAEIEKLKNELEQAKIEISKHFDEIEKSENEAIKEFAERLKEEVKTEQIHYSYRDFVEIRDINNLVKEMTEVEE